MKIVKVLGLVALIFVMAFSACDGNDQAARLASKVKAGDRLTQEDYTEMIQYCGKYATEAQKIQDQINALPADSSQSGKLDSKMNDLSAKFPYAEVFFTKITTCTKEEVGEKNVKLINDYAPLMWFSAPDWATIDSDPDVVGFVEDMPSTDSSSVIATGDGVEVSK